MKRFLLLLSSGIAFSAAFANHIGPAERLSSPVQDVTVPPSAADNILRVVAQPPHSRDANTAAVADEWVPAGQGTYKDVLFSDFFGQPSQTLTVDFEQNASNPSLYRIAEVYKNMDFSSYGSKLTYDSNNATPMVFHLYDGYAYFEEFDTGVYMNYPAYGSGYVGNVHMLMQGVDLLAYNSVETLATYLPDCLCSFNDGNLTLEPTFILNDKPWYNILGLVYVTGTARDELFRGNTKGDFLVSLPGAADYDPDSDWVDIGMAQYTDTFLEWLTGTASFPTWEVPMQQNVKDPSLYRLVNPYAAWRDTGDGTMTYDSDNNYYMTLIMQHYDGFSLVGIPTFYTGLRHTSYGDYAVSNQAADALKSTDDFLTLYYNYPGCLGVLENGIISYPSHCVIEMEYYQNFYGYFGQFDINGSFVSANSTGDFRIVMPRSGLNDLRVDDDNDNVEYYNLQGIKIAQPASGQITIMRKGNKSQLIIHK